MGDEIFQNELDQLLRNAIGGNEDTETSPDTKDAPSNNFKTYRLRKNNNDFRYPTPYRSPIIKEQDTVYNPQPGQKVTEGKIVVMSLDNYLASKIKH